MIQFVLTSQAKRGQALLDPFYKWETENTGRLLELFKALPKISGKTRTELRWMVPKC